MRTFYGLHHVFAKVPVPKHFRPAIGAALAGTVAAILYYLSGRMVGIFSDADVRRFIYDETIWTLADASDIMVTKFLFVTVEDDLNSALQKFTRLNLDELPVLDSAESGRLLGMLRRKESIAAYNRKIMERKQDVARHAE